MEDALSKTKKWLENIVIGLGLCPFAGKAYFDKQVGFTVLSYTTSGLTQALNEGISKVLNDANPLTTLLIVLSEGLEDFDEYLDVYYGVEEELERSGLSEKIQLANFHPHYQFAGVEVDAVENYTNRSPFPVFHILHVDEVAIAIDSHPDIDSIPKTNIATMQRLGIDEILKLMLD